MGVSTDQSRALVAAKLEGWDKAKRDEQAVKANVAVQTLLDDVENVLDLDGSRRCILKSAIVGHLAPAFGMRTG